MDLNKAMIIGNVVRDPEIRQTGSGLPVASLSIATNMVWKDQQGQKQERADFHNIIAWRGLADVISRFVKKGSKIYVEGRIQNRSWVGQDGQKRYTTEIVADNLIMLDRMGAIGGQMNGGQGYQSNPRPSSPANPSTGSGFENSGQTAEPTISYEEIPAGAGFGETDINVNNIPF